MILLLFRLHRIALFLVFGFDAFLFLLVGFALRLLLVVIDLEERLNIGLVVLSNIFEYHRKLRTVEYGHRAFDGESVSVQQVNQILALHIEFLCEGIDPNLFFCHLYYLRGCSVARWYIEAKPLSVKATQAHAAFPNIFPSSARV